MNKAIAFARVGRMDESESDRELVTAVLTGDKEAYAVLVRRHQERLYRHALGMVLDPDVAADLVQDSFVNAYRRLNKCRDRSSFATWLHRIVRNRCLDHLKERRRKDLPLDDHLQVAWFGAGPESDLDRRILGEMLDGALARLPGPQREAFLLKHVQELTYEEMAEVTGASMSALRMRVLRAREALQSILGTERDTAVAGM